MSGIEALSQFFENIRPRYSWSSSDSTYSNTSNENELGDIHSPAMESTPIVTPTSSPASSPIITSAELHDEACSASGTNNTSEFRSEDTTDLGSLTRDARSAVNPQNDTTVVAARESGNTLPPEWNYLPGPPRSLPPRNMLNNPLNFIQETRNQVPIQDSSQMPEQRLSSTMEPAETQQNRILETPLVAESTTTAEDNLPVSSSLQNAFTSALPEDDGNSLLRQKVREIQTLDVSEKERAWRMHALMTEKYKASSSYLKGPATHQKSKGTSPERRNQLPNALTPADAAPSYFNESEGILGCSHYRRGVKLQCSTCERWYPCRFCHDEIEDHALIRKETKNMLCMHCGKAQPAQQSCKHCSNWMSRYYCDKVSIKT